MTPPMAIIVRWRCLSPRFSSVGSRSVGSTVSAIAQPASRGVFGSLPPGATRTPPRSGHGRVRPGTTRRNRAWATRRGRTTRRVGSRAPARPRPARSSGVDHEPFVGALGDAGVLVATRPRRRAPQDSRLDTHLGKDRDQAAVLGPEHRGVVVGIGQRTGRIGRPRSRRPCGRPPSSRCPRSRAAHRRLAARSASKALTRPCPTNFVHVGLAAADVVGGVADDLAHLRLGRGRAARTAPARRRPRRAGVADDVPLNVGVVPFVL